CGSPVSLLIRHPTTPSFPLVGKVATPAMSRGSRMGVKHPSTTPTPALRADPPHKGEGQRRFTTRLQTMHERTARDWMWIVLLGCLQLLPIAAIFLNSVAVDWAGTILPDGYTLKHVSNILNDPRFLLSIQNSLIV